MSTGNYDVVIIGAGAAGMTAATLLARDCGKKVLVIERAPFIGGRLLSYVGRGDKVVADGIEMDARAFEKSLPHAACYLGKCTPDIETIFARGLLDGRTFEAGGHGLFWGERNRAALALQHFGRHVGMPLNHGLGFVEWQGFDADGSVRKTTSHQVEKSRPYSWMSTEGYAKTLEQLGDMARLTPEEMVKLWHVSLQDWLEARGMHREAYDYVKVLAASQTGMAEPRMTAAPDFLCYMAMAGKIGMNLVKGSVATIDEPGGIAITLEMEKSFLEYGGEVWRDTPVTGVLVEDGAVRGLSYRRDKQTHGLRADTVICTIPPKHAFNVLPAEAFPPERVQFFKDHWGIGLLTGWVGTRRPIIGDLGLDESSFVYMPAISTEDEGFIGVVDMVMCNFSAWRDGTARRGGTPDGRSEFLFSTALTDREMRDRERVNVVIERCEAWARANFPTWDEDVEFILWTPSPEALGTYRPLGTDRPAHKDPYVKGLWFAGDQYGEEGWGCGVDMAVLSAVVCVDRMLGTRFEKSIFPEYHWGFPVGAEAH